MEHRDSLPIFHPLLSTFEIFTTKKCLNAFVLSVASGTHPDEASLVA